MSNKSVVSLQSVVHSPLSTYQNFYDWLLLDIKDLAVRDYEVRLFEEAISKQTYLIDVFENNVKKNPSKCFLVYNDATYTYADVDRKANRMARVLRSWGLKKGDIMATFMLNEPQFIWTFIGAVKLGVPVCTINTHLRNQALVDCVATSQAKAVICSSDQDIVSAIREVISKIHDVSVYIHDLPPRDCPSPCLSIQQRLASVSDHSVDMVWREHVQPQDALCYVFTSGTTGNPKPALLTQIRALTMMVRLKAHASLSVNDVLYTCLPMYHAAALFFGLMGVMETGASMVLRRKFSATKFWDDCRKHQVTGFLYIGELCRYLLAKPPTLKDGEHSIRFAYGNGLRRDIWGEFQKRFKIPQILEHFGATEGTGSFINLHNKPGAVGRYSPNMAWRDNNARVLVKYNINTATPVRDENGFCINVEIGEPGLLLIRFPPYIDPEKIYMINPENVREKIVRNVHEDGDVFFNFGDILYRDEHFFLYFVDRIGDTFRWKGENVSTQEVANTLASLGFILDANVYGVEIPGNDGKAGMACLILKNGHKELTETMRTDLYNWCERSLPKYSRPIFLRVADKMELTDTLKPRKVRLMKEGFDVNLIQDALYYINSVSRSYSPLTKETYNRYMCGDSKL